MTRLLKFVEWRRNDRSTAVPVNARTHSAPSRFLLGFAVLLPTLFAAAQTAEQSQADPELPSVLRDNPNVPGWGSRLRPWNAAITLMGVHDSVLGWSTLVTPAVSYGFLGRYSLDLSIPVYLYRLAESETEAQSPPPAPGEPPVEQSSRPALLPHTFDPGDLFLAAHAVFGERRFSDVVTPAVSFPTGDSSDGLSTGRVTFDLDNHFELSVLRSVLIIDLGGGDSSSLVDRPVTSDYTSLGALAHFQAGMRVPLSWLGTFQSVAYEQLPLGDNKIYTTVTRRGYPDQTVVSGTTVSEDNGFTNSMYLPLTHHLALQGYYNRSLRLHLDTVGIGVSFMLRRSEALSRRSLNY